MIEALPTDKRRIIIIVHSITMRSYVRNLVRQVRPDIHPNQYNVMILEHKGDIHRFVGIQRDTWISIDHEALDNLEVGVLSELKYTLGDREIHYDY